MGHQLKSSMRPSLHHVGAHGKCQSSDVNVIRMTVLHSQMSQTDAAIMQRTACRQRIEVQK